MKLNLDFSDFSASAAPSAARPAGREAPASVDDFVRQYEPQARRVAERLKVPVDAVLGQWGLETGWGKSVIPGTNNLGNIMDFSGGGVAAVDNQLGRTDKYRAYGSADEFADDFGNLVESGNRGRYRSAVGAKDAQSYFQALKQGGYAEDPNYVNSGVASAKTAADALARVTPQQQAAPKSDFSGIPAWDSITSKAEYKALTPEKQAEAKAAYFDYYIAPRVGQDAASIRQTFLAQQAPAQQKPRPTEGLGQSDPVFDAPQPYEAPTGSVMDAVRGQRTDAPEGVTQSLAPLAPEARRAIENSYNAMTPEQRIALGQRPGAIGQFATELNQRYGLIDKNPAKTAERIDPRAEKRAVRMAGDGLEGEAAQNMARTAARLGVMPGQEILGSVGETKFDFDTAEAFRNDPILSNPLVRGLTKGGVMYLKSAAGMGEAMSDLVFGAENTGKRSTEYFRGKEDAIGEAGTMMQRNFEGAISSIVSQLPAMAGGAVTGGSRLVALAGMAMNSFGNEYTDGKAKGLDPGSAATRAALFSAFEVVGESFGLGGALAAVRKMGQGIADPGELARFFANNLKKEIPGEVLTTTGQFGVDKMSGIGLNQQAGLEDYLKQVADTIVQTVMQGGIMAGGTTGVSRAVRFLRNGDTNSAEAQFSRELNRQIEGGEFTTTAEQAATDAFARGPQAGLEMRMPGGAPNAPAPTIPGASINYATNAQVTPDGRLEVTTPTKPVDPLVQAADDIVGNLADEAGIPRATVLPGSIAPSDVEDIQTQIDQLEQQNPSPTLPVLSGEDDEVQQADAALDGSGTLQAPGQADVQGQATGQGDAGQGDAQEAGVLTPQEPASGTQAPQAQQVQPQAPQDAAPAAAAPAAEGELEPPRTEKEARERRRRTDILTPDGGRVEAQWDVVEADDVKASMKEGVSQPRDRTRAASNAQIAEIANNPDFERLSDTSKTMDYGAPTLTADGAIVGGNGRFEGVSQAYGSGTGQKYRDALLKKAADLGLDPAAIAGMKKPILVRRVTAEADTRKLAIQSNQAAGLQMTDMEQAALDAERMTELDSVQISDTGDIPLTGVNVENIRRALAGYTTNELAGMMTADGGLSQSGLRRVRNAILYKAYGKTESLARLIESPDADMKNVGTALVRAAGRLAQVRGGIASQEIPAEYDIASDLNAAIETLSQLRATGTKVEDFLAQTDLFGDGISAEAREILKFISANLRSAKNITEFLNDYATAVLSARGAGTGLFGDEKLPSKLETIRNVKQRFDDQAAAASSQQSIFDEPAGQTGQANRGEPANQAGDAQGNVQAQGQITADQQQAQDDALFGELMDELAGPTTAAQPAPPRTEKEAKTQRAQKVEQKTTPSAKSSPDLDGVKVTFDVLVEDTGQTAKVTVDAKQHMQELDEREAVLRELVDCLST